MLKRLLLFAAYLLLPFCYVLGQLITTDPAVAVADQSITITFDATQGTGGLADCNCEVYIHTGLITELSTDASDWQYVQTEWGVANNDWKLTPVPGEPNKYTYTIDPSIIDYYGVPSNEAIEQMAFVFRNADGSLEGKATGGADIFVDVTAGGDMLSTSLTGDPGNTTWPLGLALPVSGGASIDAELTLFDNEVEVASFTGTSFSYDLIFTTSGTHEVRLEATANGQTVSSSFTVEAELKVAFTAPTEVLSQVNLGEMYTLMATSYIDAAISLSENDSEIETGTTNIEVTRTAQGNGVFTYEATASYQGETATDSRVVIAGVPEVMDPPSGFDRGITRTENGLFLQLYAPGKEDVFVIGNFNNWVPNADARMRRSTNGEIFWIELTNLPAGEDVLFQYFVNPDIRIADPYSTLVLDQFNDPFISDATF
ncbi:MAG: hypothetical protein AAFU67_17230, partial [Bacteroidota bacterium]